MSKAAYVIRQSQGTDDSISLGQQRKQVAALAGQLADETEKYDFGNFTGFSIRTKGPDEERIDAHPEMQELLERLRAGEFDYLVALDDTRIARDGFFEEVKGAVLHGGAEFAFVRDVEDLDSLTHGVKRTVETKVKQDEIQKGKVAWEEWAGEAEHVGRPPKGLKYNGSGDGLEPDDEFETVADVILWSESGLSYREIRERTDYSTGTIANIRERGRDFYEQFGEIDGRNV